MQFMQLEMLVAVVKQGSVSKAASHVYRTQPAVSGALKKLAEELGEPLFLNSSRAGTTLSEAGTLLYEYAVKILALRDEAALAAQELAASRRGCLRVGADDATALHYLPSLAERFIRLYPKAKLELIVDTPAALSSALAAKKLDVALLPEEIHEPNMVTHLAVEEDMVLITSPDRLATGAVNLRDITHDSIIIQKSAKWLRAALEEAFAQIGAEPYLSVETDSVEMIKRLVSRSLGVGLVPRMCVERECAAGTLSCTLLADLRLYRKVWVTRRSDNGASQVCRNFVQMMAAAAHVVAENTGKRAPRPSKSQLGQQLSNGALRKQRRSANKSDSISDTQPVQHYCRIQSTG